MLQINSMKIYYRFIITVYLFTMKPSQTKCFTVLSNIKNWSTVSAIGLFDLFGSYILNK